MTALNFIDDSELEETGAADLLMDDNAVAAMPRPGTSLNRPMTKSSNGGDQSIRPMTQSGRPLSGFARPGTSTRPGSGAVSVDQAFKGSRPGTSRPATTLGRQVRLGTASMQADPGGFINTERLDFRKYATRPPIAKVSTSNYVDKSNSMLIHSVLWILFSTMITIPERPSNWQPRRPLWYVRVKLIMRHLRE